MLAWWTFATLCTAALAAAAWMIERVAHRAGRAARGVWATALVAGIAWPAVAWLWATPAAVLVSARPAPFSLMAWLRGAVSAVYLQASGIDAWLLVVWVGVSAALVLIAFGSHRHLVGVARRGHAARLTGVAVRLGGSEGPAVFGILRPHILMPTWIAGAPVRERRLALVHELSHVRAGDLPLLWASFGVVCLAPWNAAAWWVLHRLRHAVELDCDRRVLRRHRNAAGAYGSLLIRAARSRARLPVPVAGLPSRRSLLRRRIECLGRRPTGSTGWMPWAIAALATTVGAAGVLPVPVPRASTFGQMRAIEVPRAELQEEPTVGVYRVGPVPDGTGGVLRARAREDRTAVGRQAAVREAAVPNARNGADRANQAQLP